MYSISTCRYCMYCIQITHVQCMLNAHTQSMTVLIHSQLSTTCKKFLGTRPSWPFLFLATYQYSSCVEGKKRVVRALRAARLQSPHPITTSHTCCNLGKAVDTNTVGRLTQNVQSTEKDASCKIEYVYGF